tara:strand:- start:209 stop:535 length:327 start_codon:yes stop_codon:yes gene_type:complete
MTKKYIYQPGDLLIEYWDYDGKQINVARYLVISKEEITHCDIQDIGYTSYYCYVMYTYDPWKREDRNGLLDVGKTYEIIHWNDMDDTIPPYTDRLDVVQSGLSWEDMD